MKRKHFSTSDRRKLLERHGCKCQMCTKPITAATGCEFDHHIPLAIGGEDTLDNLRPLCRKCHALKTKGDVKDIAKAKRRNSNHFGYRAPSKTPMLFGKNSIWKKCFDGSVINRNTGEVRK